MKIECQDLTVKEVLESSYYEIPRFQRPYSWEKDNLEDFWKDVFKSNEKDYFIGSIVTYKSGDARAIVDGQQRITSVTILLSALRNTFDEIGSINQADGIQRLIERYDLENKLRHVLETETSFPYLQHVIQSRTPDLARTASGDEDELLKAANEYFQSQIEIEIQEVSDNGVQSEAAIKLRKHKRLENLRDTILSLKLILVQLDNEDDAYLVFETLNTRGKDLTTSDLLKNLLARLLRASNSRGDKVRSKWQSLVDNIKAIELDDVSVDDFIYHYWLAKNDFTKSRNIFKAAKQIIKTKQAAEKTLNEIESYSIIYKNIFRPNLKKWRNDELKIKASIEVIINKFRVSQPLPLMLTALSKYSNNTLSKSELVRLLSAIELFTFVNLGIMNTRSKSGILQMYSSHARELSRSNALVKRENTIVDLISKLRSKLPIKEDFIKRFSELKYSDDHPAEKRLVQYSLTKLMEIIAPTISLDSLNMSIEHIAPQAANNITIDSISSIGNLWYLNTAYNNQLGDLGVNIKLSKYREDKLPCDDMLQNAIEWNSEVIQNRALFLADNMWNLIDSVFE